MNRNVEMDASVLKINRIKRVGFGLLATYLVDTGDRPHIGITYPVS